MSKLLTAIVLFIFGISITNALEPIKVAIVDNGGGALSVQVNLTNYTDGITTNIFTSTSQTLTPNGSGIIIVNISDATYASGTLWSAISSESVNSYYLIDINVGGTLYAQYRLDQQLINQSQSSAFDNDGNLSPSSNGAQNLGNDGNRWGELFLNGNTLHVGPGGGMAGNDELAFSYDDATNKATMTVAGTDEVIVNSDGTVITGGITANPTGANKDFIFGDNDFNYSGTGTDTKMFFDKSKGAFRAGAVSNTNWDDGTYVGNYSTAMGLGTMANGNTSTAMGSYTTASGDVSTAMGSFTITSGDVSTAMGSYTTASGDNSTAMGIFTTASGDYSTAMGSSSKASAYYSTTMGNYSEASGSASTAMGYHTKADEDNSTAMGVYNDNTVTGELLTIGNGTLSTRSNAFEVYKNGNVVIGDNSSANHTVKGKMTIENVLDANGSTGSVAVRFSATAPTNPVTGSLWYDSANSKLKIWNGSSWTAI